MILYDLLTGEAEKCVAELPTEKRIAVKKAHPDFIELAGLSGRIDNNGNYSDNNETQYVIENEALPVALKHLEIGQLVIDITEKIKACDNSEEFVKLCDEAARCIFEMIPQGRALLKSHHPKFLTWAGLNGRIDDEGNILCNG